MSFVTEVTNVQNYGVLKDEFPMERGDITFYCRECEKVVEVDRLDDKKMKFVCCDCGSKKISYGTQEGVKEFYSRG